MRGGVSLSVWIGGAVAEIDALRRAVQDEADTNVMARLAHELGCREVEIDVISGASAGGLNGAILSAALVNGTGVDTLRRVWLQAADLQQLLFPVGMETRLSILQGDYFLSCLQQRLDDLFALGSGERIPERLDLFLSVSSIKPYVVRADPDPSAPITERRIDGMIHFRHRAGNESTLNARDLALAARCTASFPVAFQPVRVLPERFKGTVQFRPVRPDPLLLYDGGVVDNMPVGKAVRAIETAPAEGRTQRYLLYLFPSPSVASSDSSRMAGIAAALQTAGARPLDVLQSAINALRGKSLIDDLEELERHNASVKSQLRDRARLLHRLDTTKTLSAVDLDAERLVDLLRNPWDHIDELTTPYEPPSLFLDRPDGFWGDLYEALVARLVPTQADLGRIETLPSLSRGSPRPWSAIIRCSSLLIEWCRHEEESADATIGEYKRAAYAIRDTGYRRASVLNRQTLDHVNTVVKEAPSLSADDTAACVVDGRLEDVWAQIEEATSLWHELGSLAVSVAELAPVPTAMPAEDDYAGWLPFVLADLIQSERTPARASRVLDIVDVTLLPLHRNSPAGSLQVIDYHTVVGTALSPLSREFEWPCGVSVADAPITSLKRAQDDPTAQDVGTGAAPRCDPGSKLAGNQFHNFAAFLDVHWRASDWMWGEADAASTLVDVLLARGLPDPARVEALCTGPMAPPSTGWPQGWEATINGLRDRPWTASVKRTLQSASEGDRYQLSRGLLLWRRHLEIMTAELARCARENPTGKAPKDSVEKTMRAWDETPRRLSDRWGERKTTALGSRAAFVALKTAFAGVHGPLTFVRAALTPVVGPSVGLFLARRRSVFAVAVFLLAAVLPRTYSSSAGRVAVAAMIISVALGGLWLTRPRGSAGGRHRQTPFAVLTIVVAVLAVPAAILLRQHFLARVLPPSPATGFGWSHYVLPVGATVVATFVTWFWARWPYRLFVTALNAGIVGAWMWMGGHAQDLSCACVIGRSLNRVGSFWWAVLALPLVTTLIAGNIDVAAYPPDAPPPALCDH